LIIIAIALLVFGTSKFSALGKRPGRRHPKLQIRDERSEAEKKEKKEEEKKS